MATIARMTGGRGRVGTWVRRILLGVAAVVVLLVVGTLVLLGTLGWRTERAATAAYEEQVEPGQQELADLAVLLERDLGAPVAHAARGLACRVDHADAGWFVDHYYQECSWQGIAYVAVDDLDGIVAEHGWETAAPEACTRLDLPVADLGFAGARMAKASRRARLGDGDENPARSRATAHARPVTASGTNRGDGPTPDITRTGETP